MSPTLTGTARVLAVCGDGTCRAATLERLLAPALGPGVEVVAVGLRAAPGAAITPGAVGPVLEHGGSVDGFAARRLVPADALGADLVLALSRAHAADVVRTAPRAARWTFTLRELARLLEGARVAGRDPAARVRAAAGTAARRRADVGPPRRPEDEDVPDPSDGPAGGFADSAAVVASAVAVLARVLGPAPARSAATTAPTPIAPTTTGTITDAGRPRPRSS
ncbi:arsenate reductase/protein-tyrosine-phosphatase family protein [Pseudokineococcus sp. 1T1Z-3]|uniref:arsenate reductase/protein-tyrosine-phosphatase family protein n=1 Tax=Pseudokineococcus sp. 1T1Z-3 TaxID=3132745 RepID=UPI003095F93D